MRDRRFGLSRRDARVALVVSLIAGGLLTGAPAGAAPGVTVTPNANLRDGQEVVVDFTGFPPDSTQGALQCPAGSAALGDCDLTGAAFAEIGGSGGARATLRVATLLYGSAAAPSDCRVVACEIVVLEAGQQPVFDAARRVPLAFDPAGPLLPPPLATAAPATGLRDGQVVSVAGSGFRGEAVSVAQCAAAPAPFGACDLPGQTFVETPDGAFTENHTVFSAVGAPEGQVDCRVEGACVLVVSPSAFQPRADSVVIPLGFAAGLLPPVPTVTAEPTSQLRDGQLLSVTGSGYRPDGFVGIYQCVEATDDCVWYTGVYPAVDGEGHFSSTFAVDAIISDLTETDCRAARCMLRVSTSLGGGSDVSIPLAFDPDAPLRPPPIVTVEPTTGLADGATVHISGTGFVPNRSVAIEQCLVGDLVGRCDNGSTSPHPDADGTIDATLPVWIDVVGDDGASTACDVAPGCEIVVRGSQPNATFRTPISFGPRPPSRGRYFDPVFDAVDVQRDIAYRSTIDSHGDPIDLKIDVYQPVGDVASVRPAMVWFHGGYFSSGDKSNMENYARAFARRGYVTASVQYRLRPENGAATDERFTFAMVDAYFDADAAIAWLRDHHGEYRIDPKAIAAGGYSAGAITALNLAYMPGPRGPENFQIAAAVSIAGHNAAVAVPERGEPPSQLFIGTNDMVVPFSLAQDSCDAVTAAGLYCELVSYPGSGHEIVDTRQRDIERRAADFLAAQVLRPRGFLAVPPVADAGPECSRRGIHEPARRHRVATVKRREAELRMDVDRAAPQAEDGDTDVRGRRRRDRDRDPQCARRARRRERGDHRADPQRRPVVRHVGDEEGERADPAIHRGRPRARPGP